MAHPWRGSLVPRFLFCLWIIGCALLSPARLWAVDKVCTDGSPAVPVPSSLWGDLQPEKILFDATRFSGGQLPNKQLPISTSVDVENGYIFHSYYGGFSIWDGRTNPGDPTRLSFVGGWEGGFPNWPGLTEFSQIVFAIDAPEGDDTIMAVGAITPVGLSIWDTSDKTQPRAVYVDTKKMVNQVYTARIAGHDYAFAADFQSDLGLHVYDMTVARRNTTVCKDNATCSGVYITRVGAKETTKYVDGLAVGTRHFVAKSGGYPSGAGIQIWEVTNPQAPQLVVEDFRGSGFGETFGVALWSQNGRHYLASRLNGDGKIYDATACLTTGCSGLQNSQVWSAPLQPYPRSLQWLGVTFSRSGSTPFLYFGNSDPCRQGAPAGQTEYLYDVSNPAQPDEITPTGTIEYETEIVGYWDWYLSDSKKGFGSFTPRSAKFNGTYLYRAGGSIFDIHKWTGSSAGPPVASFTWSPSTIYAGDPVSFTSTSSGAPTGFTWTFPDGSPPAATGGGSAQTAFASAGDKAVSLTVSNQHGPSTANRNVTVLDPAPAVGSITVTPANPLVCQPVTLKAENVTGKAPLSLQWTVNQQALGSANPVTWNTNTIPPVAAGTYSVAVIVSKAGYPDATRTTSVTLNPLPALPAAGAFAPTTDPFAAGTVQFHVNAAGATEWKWDFGDGTGQGWTSDPVAGPNPVHSYLQPSPEGQPYMVKVWVRNCAQGGTDGILGAPLPVTVTSVAPLKINQFQAQGCQVFCDFAPGQTITFDLLTEGGPTQYEYDWNGNGFGGADDQTSATPVTTHAYAEGTYSPVLRVRRGTEVSLPWTHLTINVRPGGGSGGGGGGGGGGTASVSVNGPGSGLVDQPYSFTATGSNCTPGSWTWTAGAGAAIAGNGSASVSITWSSAGSKSVQATTSGCGTGSRAVSISSPSSGGLQADFTFSPASPLVNQSVSFNGGASTGSPAIYFWEFGDGASASTPTAAHAYASPGPFSVKLTIAKDCVSGVCGSQSSVTKQVIVLGAAPLTASFSTSATCITDIVGVRCEVQTGQAVTFTSTGAGASSYSWSFSDGTPAATGAQVSHAWSAPGSYLVQLTVSDGKSKATASDSRLFVVSPGGGGGGGQVTASFNTSATCTNDVTGPRCAAQTGQAVTFTSTGTGATSYSWSFSDGTPAATGAQVSHTWTAPGSYLVQLTAGNGQTSASASRLFVVTPGTPGGQPKAVVLPWIAQTRGALVQSSDLYVNNPGKTAMDVTLEFRKRGVPESNPPRVPKTIQPGATLYVEDVLNELFDRENVAGFITVKVDKGDVEPIITSFNTTFQANGKQFGQTVSGVSMSNAGSAASTGPESRMQHLVGLINNTERLAYFGISNPNDEAATYHLRFFDQAGKLIGESSTDLTLSKFGQRQYQVKDIHDLFGISSEEDYRVEIETKSGGRIVPYASNLRLSSEDPSFIEPGSSRNAKAYLIGVLSVPGLNNSLWQSDVLLSNTTGQELSADVTFTSVGLASTPTPPLHVALPPGQTTRLENVIAGQWGIRNAIGVLTVSGSSAGGVFPIVQGESYENTNPLKRFGQSMTAVSESDAAVAGRSQHLVGLRQDAKNRTTFWLFNPGSVTGEYDVVYRNLDGSPLGTVAGVRLGAGKMRQFSPGQHPLPAAGALNGFTVEIVVKGGKALSAAQVINNITNDPAYIKGEVR